MAFSPLGERVKGFALRAYDSVSRPLHPSIAELIGLSVPAVDGPWLEAFNGQHARQQLVRAILRTVEPYAVFEAGSYRGATTRFLWYASGKPVFTAEKNRSFARYVGRVFRHVPEVKVINRDSRDALRVLHDGNYLPSGACIFFYLDAHWNADLPLREEVEFITGAYPESVILIDDFKVPDDEGYGFDVYGPVELSMEYLAGATGRYRALWPSVSSDKETGYRRGCVVLAGPDTAQRLQTLSELRTLPGLPD
ncbi:MAG TPA: hypothetical protein VE546_12075 [Streptomyces sp.]|uniref:hypothetical protein n=1 Tax=Streptomyces sp. TaxID=1931 RepID=UPI002D224540|nr:hypothetical protein [Streptomyces sp.]HZG04292.1 hypothetical protein [Streptomyces sp.]